MLVSAQHNKFIQDNPPHTNEENDRICMQRRKQMEIVPFDPRLEYVCVRNYCTPSPLRYALTIKNPVGSGTTM
jgi:hypothetical protein